MYNYIMVQKKYLTGLTKKEKEQKIKSIEKTQKLLKQGKKKEAIAESKKRPTTKKGKESSFTIKFKKKFGNDVKPLTKKFTDKTGISLNIQKEIIKRGRGAFLSAGSRASVSSATQWSYARLYAFYFKGLNNTLDFDLDLFKKVKLK
jgi:hypothetical protein